MPDRLCPVVGGAAICAWPGRVQLALDAQGGRFEYRVHTDRTMAVALPGSAAHWPSDVKRGAARAVVLSRDGAPVVHLPAGDHVLSGRFAWPRLPEVLELPERVAAVDLAVEGDAIEFPRRDGGTLWLASAPRAQGEGERLALTVQRRIEDGVPVRVITRIAVRASGRARELPLGSVLLPGTQPVAVSADLPARLDADGTLTAQVRAGSFEIEVLSRFIAPPEGITAPVLAEPWPKREVWVFEADTLARQVEVSGAPSIDPARTELPASWRELPAFSLSPGATLALTTRRRGQPEAPPNQLRLERELWLDLDGDGYTVRDQLGGTLSRGFRLDLLAGALGHVSESGVDQLITRPESGEGSGVELRREELSMTAEWRGVGGIDELPAVGWSEDVSALSTTLNLPPGYRLLAAEGVDRVQTWMSRWDLLDFFVVLLVGLAVGRVLGRRYGVLALLATALCAHEADAPQAVWLSVTACVALLRVLGAGRFRRALQVAFGLVLLVLASICLPFVTAQIRMALYPQLERQGAGVVRFDGGGLRREEARGHVEQAEYMEEEASESLAEDDGAKSAAAPMPVAEVATSAPSAPPPGRIVKAKMGRGFGGAALADTLLGTASSDPAAAPDWLSAGQAQDPAAVVQTGPGVPSWQFDRVQLEWTGPVERGHRIKLHLLPPAANRTWALLRVALVVALGLCLLLAGRRASAAPPPERPGGQGPHGDERTQGRAGGQTGSTAAGAALALLLWLLGGGAMPTAAQTPDPGLLRELEARLGAPPACRPDCLDVPVARLQVGEGVLRFHAEVHAGAATSLRLPGPAQAWAPAAVQVGGTASHALAVLDDGFVHLRLAKGLHRVEVVGPVPQGDTVTLALGDVPRRLTVDAPGWEVSGLREDGRPADNLVLSRELSTGQRAGGAEGRELPAFTRLTRTFVIGTTWQVHNELVRLSPLGSPVVVRLPLLEGESATDAAVEVEAGQLAAALGRDQRLVRWTSTLTERARLGLTATRARGVTERWVLRCSPVWHCAPTGIAPVRHVRAGRSEPEFRPWPTETLRVDMHRPGAADGITTTIDQAVVTVTPGVRLLEGSLGLELRSSVGGVHRVVLPAQAKVQSLWVAGEQRAVRQQDSALGFRVEPGSTEVRVTWQQPGGLDGVLTVPAVDVGARAANGQVRMELPPERVVIWAAGPQWGPAVLFWGYLLLVLLLGVGLSRVPRSPLPLGAWLLLCLGLSQLPWAALLVVLGWFFAIQRRGRAPALKAGLHNLRQLGLIAWTLTAAGCLYGAVHEGLLMRPDMQVLGAGSHDGSLAWIIDNVAGAMPRPTVVSIPLWSWKLGMLLWALWLSASLVRWIPWAWGCFSHQGRFMPWRAPVAKAKPASSSSAGRSASGAPGASGASAASKNRDELP